MSVIDIRRKGPAKVKRIIFSDDNNHGLGKACYLEDAFPSQVNITSRGGHNMHIKYDDIDHLIAALRKAKELWHEP